MVAEVSGVRAQPNLLMLAAALAMVGCPAGSRQSSPSCAEGSERCTCYRNNTCDDGLECLSNRCVNTHPDSSPNGGAMSTAAGARAADSTKTSGGATTKAEPSWGSTAPSNTTSKGGAAAATLGGTTSALSTVTESPAMTALLEGAPSTATKQGALNLSELDDAAQNALEETDLSVVAGADLLTNPILNRAMLLAGASTNTVSSRSPQTAACNAAASKAAQIVQADVKLANTLAADAITSTCRALQQITQSPDWQTACAAIFGDAYQTFVASLPTDVTPESCSAYDCGALSVALCGTEVTEITAAQSSIIGCQTDCRNNNTTTNAITACSCGCCSALTLPLTNYQACLEENGGQIAHGESGSQCVSDCCTAHTSCSDEKACAMKYISTSVLCPASCLGI